MPLDPDVNEFRTNWETGQDILVTNLQQFSENLNETVTGTLRGSKSFGEYPYLENSSFTYHQNPLQLMMSEKLNGSRRKRKRTTTSLCPKIWIVDEKANCEPSIIKKAVCVEKVICTGEEATCFTCTKITEAILVKIFLGHDKNGNKYWQYRTEKVPVDWTSSKLTKVTK